MWIDDEAEPMSRNIGGKKFRPSTWTATVDATVSSNASAKSASRTDSRNTRSAWARTSSTVLTSECSYAPSKEALQVAEMLSSCCFTTSA